MTTAPAAGARSERRLAVAIHDVEPATYERCALIRDWLYDHEIDRATLLVIPAPDLHPFSSRRPELVDWLGEQHRRGDAIAQHGLQHLRMRRPRPGFGDRAAEFTGLSRGETRSALLAGRRVLKLAGIDPRGFVAPAYAYTPALREELAGRYEWWAGLMRCYRRVLGVDAEGEPERRTVRGVTAPALALSTSSRAKRALSPLSVRTGALLSGPTLRLDLHPADFAHPGHVRALEWTLRRAAHRKTVTYDELLGG